MIGMRSITGMEAEGTEGCKIIFSFGRRNTWYYFDEEAEEFRELKYDEIYTKGTPIDIL